MHQASISSSFHDEYCIIHSRLTMIRFVINTAGKRHIHKPPRFPISCITSIQRESRNGSVKSAFMIPFYDHNNNSRCFSSAAATTNTNLGNDKETVIDSQIQADIMDKCTSLHSSIMPLNEKLRGPLAKNSDKGTSLPFVFLVGNHSSGKSSFINYVLGRNVQTAGVAPTDDCFTVIAPGPIDSGTVFVFIQVVFSSSFLSEVS